MRERERIKERKNGCVCVRKRDTVCGLDRERKKERKKEREGVSERERERES